MNRKQTYFLWAVLTATGFVAGYTFSIWKEARREAWTKAYLSHKLLTP